MVFIWPIMLVGLAWGIAIWALTLPDAQTTLVRRLSNLDDVSDHRALAKRFGKSPHQSGTTTATVCVSQTQNSGS